MAKLRNILRGWYNFFLDIISDIRYKDIFEERYKICLFCCDNHSGICKHCGCVIKAKTKAEDEECPLGKWKKIGG